MAPSRKVPSRHSVKTEPDDGDSRMTIDSAPISEGRHTAHIGGIFAREDDHSPEIVRRVNIDAKKEISGNVFEVTRVTEEATLFQGYNGTSEALPATRAGQQNKFLIGYLTGQAAQGCNDAQLIFDVFHKHNQLNARLGKDRRGSPSHRGVGGLDVPRKGY